MAQVRKNPVPSSLTQSLAGLLAGCWLEGLPQFLSMRVFPLDSSQHSSKKRQREQEKACKMEAGVCHLILEVIFCHFFGILSSLGPAQVEGEESI